MILVTEPLTPWTLQRMLVVQEACQGKFEKELFPIISDSCELSEYSIEDEFECRSSFPTLQRSFDWLSEQLPVCNVFRFDFLFPHINSASIVVKPSCITDYSSSTDLMKKIHDCFRNYQNAAICIEINDENTRLLSDKSSLYGLNILKRRLLQERNWKVVTIQSEDIVKHNSCSDLIYFLIDKIVQHCNK